MSEEPAKIRGSERKLVGATVSFSNTLSDFDHVLSVLASKQNEERGNDFRLQKKASIAGSTSGIDAFKIDACPFSRIQDNQTEPDSISDRIESVSAISADSGWRGGEKHARFPFASSSVGVHASVRARWTLSHSSVPSIKASIFPKNERCVMAFRFDARSDPYVDNAANTKRLGAKGKHATHASERSVGYHSSDSARNPRSMGSAGFQEIPFVDGAVNVDHERAIGFGNAGFVGSVERFDGVAFWGFGAEESIEIVLCDFLESHVFRHGIRHAFLMQLTRVRIGPFRMFASDAVGDGVRNGHLRRYESGMHLENPFVRSGVGVACPPTNGIPTGVPFIHGRRGSTPGSLDVSIG